MTNRERWTEEEKQIVREHYRDIGTSQLSQALPRRSPGAIADMAGRMGVKKSEERLKEMGRIMIERRKKPS